MPRFGGFEYTNFEGVQENVAIYREIIFNGGPYPLKCEEARVNLLTGCILFYNDGILVENFFWST